jgi:hypothetical protein
MSLSVIDVHGYRDFYRNKRWFLLRQRQRKQSKQVSKAKHLTNQMIQTINFYNQLKNFVFFYFAISYLCNFNCASHTSYLSLFYENGYDLNLKLYNFSWECDSSSTKSKIAYWTAWQETILIVFKINIQFI